MSRGLPCRFRQGFAGDPRHELVCGTVQPTRKIALLEARGDRLIDDALGGQIGNGALECLGDLNADLAIVLGHDQQQTVPDLLAADLPGVGDPVGVTGDVFRLGGGDQ